MKKSLKNPPEQLLFFEEPVMDRLIRDVDQIKMRDGKCQRSIFAQITELRNIIVDLHNKYESVVEELYEVKCKAGLHSQCEHIEMALL